MSCTNNPPSNDVSAGLKKIVDRHGFNFQFAVLNEALQLGKAGIPTWGWDYVAHEFPVEVKGSGTKIDFILKTILYNESHECFLLAECKRADPKLSNWCFLRTPRLKKDEEALLEQVTVLKNGNVITGEPNRSPYLPTVDNGGDLARPYHLGLELKSRQEKGDAGGGGRDAIEQAATQLLRGLNGFVVLLHQHPYIVGRPPHGIIKPEGRRISFLPVIFTTANIFTTEVELGQADLRTGKLTVEELNATPAKWVRYRYHQSPGITHSIDAADKSESVLGPDTLLELLDRSYARDIIIVGATAVGEFLKSRF